MTDCSDARWMQIVLRGAMEYYEHFERVDMPVEGWQVGVAAHRCLCALAHKFGCCVHIIAALNKVNQPIPGQIAPVGRFVNSVPRPARAQPRASWPVPGRTGTSWRWTRCSSTTGRGPGWTARLSARTWAPC
ncbi:hypothetical protein PBRA_009693 [Plasmodiophora brassicae]|uniref:SWIM-type domain-containing protein n=1 Tax=Plasmodiophora brassicae TaxID=37360 RepID=A0A0G4IL58_PLABS|nr:hypothetical protein PBRA_009693 [Plasmodiophora brassicae]